MTGSFRSLVWALAMGAAVFGCKTHYIPNTDVEDTDSNRRIVEFCEKYRRAIETRNVPLLLELAHPSYYEDGGNTDAADDLDYAGLEEYLTSRFRDARSIRYEIRYRRILEGRKDTVLVDYTYSASYKIPAGDELTWRREVADNRLELTPSGESFRIISGM